MNHAEPWTKADVEYLTSNYPIMMTKSVAQALGRGVGAVKCKASKLGLTKSPEALSFTSATRYDGIIAEINAMDVDQVPLDMAFKHRKWLELHYVQKELSTQDIADITGCTRKNIEYWMRKFEIERRDDVTSKATERFRRKISDAGKGRIPFSKGLTKNDHPAIMKISEAVRGEKSPHWRGGTCVTVNGYRFVRDETHPHRNKDNYVLEHRMVMEFLLGRLLGREEIVHHKDRNRLNNFSTNLFLFPNNRSHMWFHTFKTHIDPTITEERFMKEVYYAVS